MRFTLRGRYGKLAKSPDKVDKDNPNGNASLCVDCDKCMVNCPQQIKIPTELKKAHAILGKGKKISDYY